MRTIKINIYTAHDTWYGARWIDGEYDGCDELDATTEDEARREALSMPLTVSGTRLVQRVSLER